MFLGREIWWKNFNLLSSWCNDRLQGLVRKPVPILLGIENDLLEICVLLTSYGGTYHRNTSLITRQQFKEKVLLLANNMEEERPGLIKLRNSPFYNGLENRRETSNELGVAGCYHLNFVRVPLDHGSGHILFKEN